MPSSVPAGPASLDQRVAFAKELQAFVQLDAFGDAGDLLGEDAFGAECLQVRIWAPKPASWSAVLVRA